MIDEEGNANEETITHKDAGTAMNRNSEKEKGGRNTHTHTHIYIYIYIYSVVDRLP